MGIAATRPITYDLTFTIGAYAWDEKKIITQIEITADDVPSAGYNVYRVGEGALTGQTSVWITRSWRLNVPIESAYDPANPDREFEIYVSLRFEGQGFGQPGDEDRVFFDRLMLVPAD
jgi:hypothetical protein